MFHVIVRSKAGDVTVGVYASYFDAFERMNSYNVYSYFECARIERKG
jgi:hypothetical protein